MAELILQLGIQLAAAGLIALIARLARRAANA